MEEKNKGLLKKIKNLFSNKDSCKSKQITPPKKNSSYDKNSNSNKSSFEDSSKLILNSLHYKKLYQSRATSKLRSIVQNISPVNATFMHMIEKITKEIDKQKQLIEKAKNVCENTKPYFTEVVSKTKDIAKVSKEALLISKDGKEEIESAISSINTIRDTVEDISKVISELKVQSEKIENLAYTITDIADNTKIIAFNSTIAAYKAGSLGASFSVVANEIKSLSHQTTEQVGEINEYILDIRNNTAKMNNKMEDSLSKVETLREVVINSHKTLNEIVSAIEKTNAVSISIKSMTNNLVVNNNDIIKKIEEINEFVGNILNLSECSLSNTKQQTDSVHLLNNASDLLYDVTNYKNNKFIDKNVEDDDRNCLNILLPRPYSLDPALGIYVNEQQFNNYISIRLTKYNENGSIIPYLAEKWILGSDKKTWRFTLKKDVKFHNGNIVKAKDVKFSIERILNPKLKSPHSIMLKIIEGSDEYITGKAKEVSGIVIENDYEISIKLKKSYNYFLSLLTQVFMSIVEKYDNYIDNEFKEPVSAGPYKLTKIDDSEEYFLLESNKDFIMGVPYIDKVKVNFYRGKAKDKFLSGKLDFINSSSFPDFVDFLKKDEKFKGKIKSFDSRTVNGINVNFLKDNFITRNKEIRQALSYAIDKDKIIKEIYNNTVTKADSMFHPSILKTASFKPFEYKPQKAREILSSYKDKENIEEEITLLKLVYKAENYYMKLIDEVYENFKSVGFNIKLVEIPSEDFKEGMFRDYDLCFMGWIPELDPYLALEPFINPNGADNFFGYNNPELYNFLSESLKIKDPQERIDYLSKVLDRFNDDVFMVPILFQKNFYIYQNNIKNIKIDAITQDVILQDLIIEQSEKNNDIKSDTITQNESFHILNNYSKAIDKSDYSINSVANISKNLLKNTNKIINLIEKQSESIEETYKIIEGFIQSSDFVEEQTKSTLSTVKSAIDESKKGKEISYTIINSLNLLKVSINSVTSVIDGMKVNIKAIANATNKIEETTENINSIAINAAIIAAKSGIWKDEFKTVSYDVRKLSTRTKDEIEKIIQLIKSMEETIERVFEKINKSIDQVENSTTNIQKSDEVLINISNVISKTEGISYEISDKIENLAEVIYQILNAMTSVKKSSYNTYNVAESVSFSSDLQSSIIESVKRLSRDLSFVYEQLKEETDLLKQKIVPASENKNILRVSLKPYTLDFEESFDVDSEIVINLFSSGLIKQENLNNLVPAIAESWELEEDNVTWIFHIRKNLKFHNGQDLTCEDVKYSLERILKVAGEDMSVGMRKIKGVDDFIKGKSSDVKGIQINKENSTVVITLTEPYSVFDNEIAFNFLVYPKNLIDNPEGRLISCGPYIFIQKNEEGKYYQFKSNKDYYEGEPFIEEIRVYYDIKDELTKFLNKELDFIPLEKKEDIDKIMRMPEYKDCIIEYSAFISCLIPIFDYDNIFTKHKEIRQAVLYAINRERIVSEIFDNRAKVQHSYLPVDMFLQSKELKIYNHNKQKAKSLIDSVKSKHNIDLDRTYKIAYHNTNNDENLNQFIRTVIKDLKEVGIKLEPVLVSRDEILDYDKNNKKWDLLFATFTPIEESIYTSFASILKSGFNGYNNKSLSEKLDSILFIKDPKIREKLILEISDSISEDLPIIQLLNVIDHYVYQPGLMNFDTNDTKVGFINFKDVWIR